MRKIRVVIIDDSAFMRKAITMMLSSDADLEVVDTARDGEEGIEKILKHKPDIATLDIEMPRMEGLEALRRIMVENPIPVIMVSSLTREGAEITLRALELGAIDFVAKNTNSTSLDIIKIKEELIRKIKTIYIHGLKQSSPSSGISAEKLVNSENVHKRKFNSERPRIIVIGASTGGPQALQIICSALPANMSCGLIIVQHMPPAFTGALAERLNSISMLEILEAKKGDTIENGRALIAPGSHHLALKQHFGDIRVELSEKPYDYLYRPSINIAMWSAAEVYGSNTLGVILTGMGCDGLDGIKKIKEKGGRSIAQDEVTSIIYGMPKAVVEAGLADTVLPLSRIAEEIIYAI